MGVSPEPVSFALGVIGDPPSLTVTVDQARLAAIIQARFKGKRASQMAARLDAVLADLTATAGSLARPDTVKFHRALGELMTLAKDLAVRKRAGAVDVFELRDAYQSLLVGKPRMLRDGGEIRFERVAGPAAVIARAYKECRSSKQARSAGLARLRAEHVSAAAALPSELEREWIDGSLPTAPSEIAISILAGRFRAISPKRIANIVQAPANRPPRIDDDRRV